MRDESIRTDPPCLSEDDRPDPELITVLYCGNLAEDDLMWVVQCPITELYKLIKAPRCWVDSLGDLPDWVQPDGEPAPRPILLDNFTMELQELESKQIAPAIVIQGISRTGIITVRASKGALVQGFLAMPNVVEILVQRAVAAADDGLVSFTSEIIDSATTDDWFAAFWEEISQDPNNPPTYKRHFDINVDMVNEQLYGHLRVYDPHVDDPTRRAEIVGTFICASCCDPGGYVHMLEGLDQTVNYLEDGQVVPGLPMSMQRPSARASGRAAGITFLYSSSVTSTGEICDVVDGPFTPSPTGGVGTPSNSTVKNYE